MQKSTDDIIGSIIGIYEVLYECDYKSTDGHKLYHVKCTQCGFETDIRKGHIGLAKICKHYNKYTNDYYDFTIKWNNPRLRSIFNGMKLRCYKPTDKNYRWYGAKGICICDEWLQHPMLFEEWAVNNGYADNLTIDRIDGNKDYCPENCRWITASQNSQYKSSTRIIDVDGEKHTGKEWATVLNLSVNLINTYIRKYGLENTIEFIRRYKANPMKYSLKPTNYYELYMNNA